jgi:hypothetical protein
MFTLMPAVSEHPPLETMTEYEEDTAGETVMDEVVFPLLHTNADPPEAVSVVLLPEQMVVFPLIAAVMAPVTFTVATAVPVQIPLLTCTVYEVVVVGVTIMAEVLAPVFHRYVPPPVALTTALSPIQIAAGVTEKIILGVTVTVANPVSAHPPLPTTTEYVLVFVGETVIAEVLAPVFQV